MIEVVDATPLNTGFKPDEMTAMCRITSYCRNAPFMDTYSHTLPYFYVALGTATGYLHILRCTPAPPRKLGTSLQAFHVAGVAGTSQKIQSTFATGVAHGIVASLFRSKAAAAAPAAAAAAAPPPPLSAKGSTKGSAKGNTTPPLSAKGGKTPSSAMQRTTQLWQAAKAAANPSPGGAQPTVDRQVTKIIFSPQSCRLLLICGGNVFCHFIDPSEEFALQFVGALTVPPSEDSAITTAAAERLGGVIDIAVTSTRDCSVMVAALTPNQIIFCTFDSDTPFHVNAIKTDASPRDKLFWCSGLVCHTLVEDKKYQFFSPHAGVKVASIPAKEHVAACELFDCWEYNDSAKERRSASLCAVMVGSGLKGDNFQSAIALLECSHDVREVRRFVVLTTTEPRCMWQWGPWICIATQLGVEVYSLAGNCMTQSICEESFVRTFTGISRASQASLTVIDNGVEQLVDCAEHEVAILDNKAVVCVRYHSPRRIFADILRMQAFDSPIAIQYTDILTKFGHSVGVSNMYGAEADVLQYIEPKQKPATEHDEYDELVDKFKDLNHPPEPEATLCADCGEHFRFFRRGHPCAACGEHFCEKCAPLKQFPEFDHAVRVCRSCYPLCHRQLRGLLENRLFAQSIDYLWSNTALHAIIPPVETGQIILQRCLDEGKYALCISLLIKVIGSDDNLWREWVQRFAVAGSLPLLARYIPWKTARATIAKWVFTLVLTTLTTRDPAHLLTTVDQWPAEIYDPVVVCTGIEQLLRRRQRDATQAYEAFKPRRESDSDEITRKRAIGLLYRNGDVEKLLRCVCKLFDYQGRTADSVRAYLEHWVQYEPAPYKFRVPGKHRPAAAQAEWFNVTQRIIDDDLKELLMKADEKISGSTSTSSFLPLLLSTWKPVDAAGILLNVNEIKTRPELIKSIVTQLIDLDQNAQRATEGRKALWGAVACPAPQTNIDYGLILCDFLDGLSAGPPKEDLKITAAFHKLQAELYIKYRPDKLVAFLRNDFISDIDWDAMSKYLRERGRYRELAYVVSRNGNYEEALHLIMRCQKSAKHGIDFVIEKNDTDKLKGDELWSKLMYHARQTPALIDEFLEHAAQTSRVNVADFLRSIPKQNRLRLDLEKVRLNLANASVNAALNDCSVGAIKEDNFLAQKRFAHRRKAAIRVAPISSSVCSICEEELRVERRGVGFSACGHMFHLSCMEQLGAKPRASKSDRRKKPRDDWNFWWSSYETHRSNDPPTQDLFELLPPTLFAHILGFLPMTKERTRYGTWVYPRIAVEMVSHGWRDAVIAARLVDRPPESDVVCLLRGPQDCTTEETTVMLGNKRWMGKYEPKCSLCAKA